MISKGKIILFILFLRISVSAGESYWDTTRKKEDDRSFAQICLIGGGVFTYREIGAIASVELSINNLLYGFSMIWAGEFDMFGPMPAETTEEYSLLVGKKFNYKSGYLSVSAGLSVINFLRRGELISEGGSLFLIPVAPKYTEKQSTELGIPVRGNFVVKFGYFGIGFHLQGNINKVESSAGGGLVVYLGSYVNPEHH